MEWIRINSSNNQITTIKDTKKNDVHLDMYRVRSIVKKHIKEGYTHLISSQNKNIEALSQDVDAIEWLRSKGFIVQNKDHTATIKETTSLIKESVSNTKQNYSKAVQKLINENNSIDFSELKGTGKNNRVTVKDVKKYIDGKS